MDSSIAKLKILGNIYIWKYLEKSSKFEGWHLTLDKECVDSLLILFRLMERSEYPSKKRVNTSIPTTNQIGVPNYLNGEARWKTKKEIIFSYKKFADDYLWKVVEHDDVLEIVFGTERLKELRNAIEGTAKGKGDFAIYNEKEESILWFWWNNQ